MKKKTSKNLKISNIIHSFGEFEDDHAIPKFIHIGRVRTNSSYSYRDHFHINFEIIYVIKGRIQYWCNGECITVGKSDFYFIQPGQTHQEQSIEEPIDFYYLKFYYLGLNGHINYFIPPPGDPSKQVLRNPNKDFISLLKEIYIEAENKKSGYKQVVDSILLYMIWLLKRQLNIDTSIYTHRMKYRTDLVNEAIDYIKIHFKEKFSLLELANECNISTYYIAHIFKESTGLSPLQYALRLRIEEAKVLIDSSNMTMREISEHLGFKDQYYFSRTFKNIIGMPPSQYSKTKLDIKEELNHS